MAAAALVHAVFVSVLAIAMLFGVLKRPSVAVRGTWDYERAFIGVPAFIAVISSCYVLHHGLMVSQWGAFSSSIFWFGLIYGYLSKNIPFSKVQQVTLGGKIMESLEVLSLCIIYAVSDYYQTKSLNFEHYTILLGIGLPMCIIAHVIGSLGPYPYPAPIRISNPPRRQRYVLWALSCAHAVSEYSWLEIKFLDPTLYSIGHCGSGILYAILVAKMNESWTNVLFQVMIAYLCFVCILCGMGAEGALSRPCYVYIPLIQLSFWLWMKRIA